MVSLIFIIQINFLRYIDNYLNALKIIIICIYLLIIILCAIVVDNEFLLFTLGFRILFKSFIVLTNGNIPFKYGKRKTTSRRRSELQEKLRGR